jgi:rRNA biogenesis protein RRP5
LFRDDEEIDEIEEEEKLPEGFGVSKTLQKLRMEEEKQDDDDEVDDLQSELGSEEENPEEDEVAAREIGQATEVLPMSRKKAKRERERNELLKEESIRKQELEMMQGEQVKTDSDYEKLILLNPNSSYIWVQYAAHAMDSAGIEKAREVMEKGLRTINFRNEVEKLNMWTAYLNLEQAFGTDKTLIK